MRRGLRWKKRLPRMAMAVSGVAMALLGCVAVLRHTGHPWLLPSFGGSCLILFGMPRGAMAQPRSLLGGHLVATLVGLVALGAWRVLGGEPELWMTAAVGAALGVMMVTRTVHSPAGANPLVVFAEQADWSFLLAPLLPGLLVLFGLAFLANNLPPPWGIAPWPRFAGLARYARLPGRRRSPGHDATGRDRAAALSPPHPARPHGAL